MARVQEEAKSKEGKWKAQVDRLGRQVEELRDKNRELQEEVKVMGEQMRTQQKSQIGSGS